MENQEEIIKKQQDEIIELKKLIEQYEKQQQVTLRRLQITLRS